MIASLFGRPCRVAVPNPTKLERQAEVVEEAYEQL